jgi:two-component sensor histidine kinase
MAHNLLLATFGAQKTSRDGGAEMWLQEANHRIANNLSLVAGLLQLQAAELDPSRPVTGDEASALLREGANRVQLVARLHRLLARTGDEAAPDLAEFLGDIVEATAALLPSGEAHQIRYEAAAPCVMAAEKALPIGLMVGELLTNSLKYAHPTGVNGVITLSCGRSVDGDLLVSVGDDGVGLPEGMNPAEASGLGLRLVNALARQVGGSLSFDQDGVGLTVSLRLPLPAAPGSRPG